MRPSAAGPVLPPPDQLSSAGFALSRWRTAPIEKTFLAQACGRESWLPAFDWLCVQIMSWSKMMSSVSAEIDV